MNPWYHNVDLRILQDLGFGSGTTHHGFQLSLDILNFTNLISSSWGVRKAASSAAPRHRCRLVRFDTEGDPVFNFIRADDDVTSMIRGSRRGGGSSWA